MGYDIGRWVAGHRHGLNSQGANRLSKSPGDVLVHHTTGAFSSLFWVKGTVPARYAGEDITVEAQWTVSAITGNARPAIQFFRHAPGRGYFMYWVSYGYSTILGMDGGGFVAPPPLWTLKKSSLVVTNAQTKPLDHVFGSGITGLVARDTFRLGFGFFSSPGTAHAVSLYAYVA